MGCQWWGWWDRLTTKEDKEAFGVEGMCMLITGVIRLWVCQNSDINTIKCDCMQSVPICKLHLNKKMQSIKGVIPLQIKASQPCES